MKIYLAGPLFSEAERMWLREVKKSLIAMGYDVCWPWELFAPGEIAILKEEAAKVIFKRCRDSLDTCDIIVAVLDGAMVDDGTAWEVGYAYANNKKIIGIRTDQRNGGECEGARVNAMVEQACEYVVVDIQHLLLVLSNVKCNGGVLCDTEDGPCACGAWHKPSK